MIELVERNREQIVALCKKHGVKRLELFGSAARGEDFDTARSDIDFFYVLDNEDGHDLADRYFSVCEELKRVLNHRIDMVSLLDAKNPYFLRQANRDRIVLYAA